MAQESRLDALRSEARAGGPQAWHASLALGRGLRLAARWPEADAELHRAITLANADADASADVDDELARLYGDQGDVGRAQGACARIAKLKGKAARAHACAAGAELVRQRASLALAETAQALSIDPRSFEAKLAEGRAHELALDLAAAEASLREALALRPDDAGAHFALGRVLRAEGHAEEGLAELRQASSLDRDDPVSAFVLAQAMPVGSERAALLERAARDRPSFVAAWVALGQLRLAEGQVAPARAAVDAAARFDAGTPEFKVLSARVALAENRADDALRAAEDALKSSPNSAPARLVAADAMARKGEIDAAIEAYQQAWGLDHGDPTPLVHAADACRAAGRDTSAVAFAQRATQEFPDWAPGWVALGDARLARGERPQAREAYGRASSATQGNVDHEALSKKLAAVR